MDFLNHVAKDASVRDNMGILGKQDRLYCCFPGCHKGGWQYESDLMQPGEKMSDAKLMVCSGCGRAWYCSKEHQTADWRNHKHACKDSQRVKELAKARNELSADEIYEGFKNRNMYTLIGMSQSLLFGERIKTHVCFFRGYHSGGGAITLIRGKPSPHFDSEFTCAHDKLFVALPELADDILSKVKQFREMTPPQHREDRIAIVVWMLFNVAFTHRRNPQQQQYVRVQMLGSGLGRQNPLPAPLPTHEPNLLSIAVNERKVLKGHVDAGGVEFKHLVNAVTGNPEPAPAPAAKQDAAADKVAPESIFKPPK